MSAKNKITVGSFWVNDFSKGCSGDTTLNHSDDLAKGFAAQMQSNGHIWKFDCGSGETNPAQFISWKGADNIPMDDNPKLKGADTVDFAYLVSHGGVKFFDMPDKVPDIFVYFVPMGMNAGAVDQKAFDFKTTRWPKCAWVNRTSKLGDKKLKWLVVDACHSCQMPGYFKEYGITLDIDPSKIWSNTFYGLNMLFGFNNLSTDGWWINDRGEEFADRACDGDALDGAWRDEAFSWWAGDSPVALACGDTEKDAKQRLARDRITAPVPTVQGHETGKWWAWIMQSK